MKTSNKILVGLFLFPFLIVLFIDLTLYAKIKKGDYVSVEQAEIETGISQKLTPFTDITVDNFTNGRIEIKHGDSFSIRYGKWEKDNIFYENQNNKLVVMKSKLNDYGTVTIYCPSFTSLSFNGVDVFVDSMHLGNVTLNVGTDARLEFGASAENVVINGKRGADISFQNNAVIDTLNMHLYNGAEFNKAQGTIKQAGTITLEDSASLNVDGITMRMLMKKTDTTTKQ